MLIVKKSRVFICSFCNFPRGSATANYIQYLACSILGTGREVSLFTNINRDFELQKEGHCFFFKGIKVIPLMDGRQTIVDKVFRKQIIKRAFIRERISKDDIVVTYFQDSYPHEAVLELKARIGFRVIACVTEWFPDDYFGNKKRQRDYDRHFSVLLPQYDLIWPISTYIEDYFKKRGCNTFVLPILADVEEYKLNRQLGEKISFVFPANGRMKDALHEVIKAFLLLSNEEQTIVELHLCGVNKKTIESMIAPEDMRRLSKLLTIHKWMKYTELVDLYNKTHYLILAREISQTTLANFPSKIPETLTYGVVPIASIVGDYTKYYLKDYENSILFFGASSNEIVEALRKGIHLDGNEYQRLSNNARKTAEQKFDYRVWIEKIENTLENK